MTKMYLNARRSISLRLYVINSNLLANRGPFMNLPHLIRTNIVVAIGTALLSWNIQAGGLDGGGGDVFDKTSSGEGYQFFDVLEYGKSFSPEDLPEYQLVKDQFDKLEKKAPRTITFLRKVMKQNLWSFVKPALKDFKASGGSNLVITYKKVQADITVPEKHTTQINQDVWDLLSREARAWLLVHASLWAAELASSSYHLFDKDVVFEPEDPNPWKLTSFHFINLKDITTTSENIRALTGFFMSPVISQESYSLDDMVTFVEANSGRVNSNTNYQYVKSVSCDSDHDPDCEFSLGRGWSKTVTVTAALNGWGGALDEKILYGPDRKPRYGHTPIAVTIVQDKTSSSDLSAEANKIPIDGLGTGSSIRLNTDVIIPANQDHSKDLQLPQVATGYYPRYGCTIFSKDESPKTRVLKTGTVIEIEAVKGYCDKLNRDGYYYYDRVEFQIANSKVDHITCIVEGHTYSSKTVGDFNDQYKTILQINPSEAEAIK